MEEFEYNFKIIKKEKMKEFHLEFEKGNDVKLLPISSLNESLQNIYDRDPSEINTGNSNSEFARRYGNYL